MGLIHSGKTVPGLVRDLQHGAFEQDMILLSSFGLKGATVLYGERKLRRFVVPMFIYQNWNNAADRETFFRELTIHQGKVGELVIKDPDGADYVTYPSVLFVGFVRERDRVDAAHGYYSQASLEFAELAVADGDYTA